MVERPSKITPETPIDPSKIKITVVGEQGVGKTLLCKKFAYGDCPSGEDKTVGSDFYSKTLKCSKGMV